MSDSLWGEPSTMDCKDSVNNIPLVPEYETPGFPTAASYHRPTIDGAAMTVEEAVFLAGLLIVRRPLVSLELGCSRGFSSLFLADAAKRVGSLFIAVDIDREMTKETWKRLEDASLTERSIVCDAKALDFIAQTDLQFGFVLIDTDLKTREEELWALWPKLDPNAIVAIHDANPEHPLRGDSNLMGNLRKAQTYVHGGSPVKFDLMYVPSPRGIAVLRKIA